MLDGDIKPISDEEFKRAQRIAERKQQRELAAKMRARPLEQIITDFAGKVEPDPTAPLGKCERCGEPFEASESGRLKDHVCKDRATAITQPVTAAERNADASVERMRQGITRTYRRDLED